jgi:hypothetical protein
LDLNDELRGDQNGKSESQLPWARRRRVEGNREKYKHEIDRIVPRKGEVSEYDMATHPDKISPIQTMPETVRACCERARAI